MGIFDLFNFYFNLIGSVFNHHKIKFEDFLTPINSVINLSKIKIKFKYISRIKNIFKSKLLINVHAFTENFPKIRGHC